MDIDSELWKRVSIRAIELGVQKRELVTEALELVVDRMPMIEVAEEIERKDDFPKGDEHYVVGRTVDGRYFFTWGGQWPDSGNRVPVHDVPNGERGIQYFDTKEEALAEMQKAIDCWE